VAGALLVAVPDPSGAHFPQDASGFAPVPLTRLPFASIVVASSDDPYGGVPFSQSCASAWGSRWFDIGPRGHINADSGLGDWGEGRRWLASLGE
jgi:predicted alpha/beta hydrolase family esterase